MDNLPEQKCIMIIAGEVSGDIHGAHLVNAMKKKDSSLSFCGIGGNSLKKAGTRIIVDAAELTVMGITEVVSMLPNIFRGLFKAKKFLESQKPDLLIIIDFADFNLRVAKTAKKLGIPVLYYIPPKIWAWRHSRVKTIKKLVDHVAVILPFEETFYRKYDVTVTFVGNPLINYNLPVICEKAEKNECITTVIGLLPGSRFGEITKHLPVMIDTAEIMAEQNKDFRFIISLASSADRQLIEGIIKKHHKRIVFELIGGGIQKVFNKSDFIIAASGTVTLEAAISGIPMLIMYKVSPVSFWIGKRLAKVKHVGLANLIAGEEVVPELLQNEANPENIAARVSDMLRNKERLEKIKNKLIQIREALGKPGVSERTADIALKMIESRSHSI